MIVTYITIFREAGLPHDDIRYFGWITADVSRLMRTVFDRRVRSLGLTRTQWLALVRVHRQPGASQSELADMMEIEKAPAGRIIDRLEEKTWIERRPDPTDRRVNRIYLTTLGERIHAAITPIAEATVHDALAGLSRADRKRVTQLMARVKLKLSALAEVGADAVDVEDIELEEREEAHVQ